MKQIAIIICTILTSYTIQAQEKDKDKISIKIGSDGVGISKGEKDFVGNQHKHKKDKLSGLVMGIGLCNVNDLNPSQTIAFNMPALNTAKSINFNITQMYATPIIKKHLYIASGLGLNINNFRYQSNLYFQKSNPNIVGPYSTVYYVDKNAITVVEKKTKIATNYLTVPLMLLAKIGDSRKHKFVLGGGASAGYLIKGWEKHIVNGNKDKNNISYAFNPFALNAIGEVGIDNRIRFYGSYALTPMFNKPLIQNAFTVGLRLGGL